MFALPEQFSTASKVNFENQLALMSALANKTFEGVEKVFDLNINTFKRSVEDGNAAAKQLLAAKDPQELLALVTAQAQPNTENALAYGRQLAGIASGLQAEFSKAAETQVAEASRKVLELVEELGKNAPAGSENAVAMLKAAIGNATAGYEQLNKTTKQAADVVEANLNTAVNQFVQPAAKAAARTAKK